MTDLKISQLDILPAITPTGAELMESATANVDNYQLPLNTVRGIGIGKAMASAYTASITSPVSGMAWKLQRILRPLGPFAPLLQTFEDDMVQDCGFYNRQGNLGTYSFINGVLNLASTANSPGNNQFLYGYETFEFPGMAISVEGLSVTPDSGFNTFVVGFSENQSSNNVINAYIETGSGSNNRINLTQTIGGTFSSLASTANNSLPAGLSGLALTLEGSGPIVWVQVNGNAWYPILTSASGSINGLTPSVLASLHPYWSVTGGTTTPWKATKFRTGYTNSTLFRDFRIVTNKDGTPYVSNGNLYFTATGNYCGIWRLNVKTGKFEKTGGVMMVRAGTNFFDLNLHVVWDQDANKWRLVFASWGNGIGTGVQVDIATYDGDILNGMHTVTGVAQLTLSQSSGNAVYDACLLYNYTAAEWVLAYAVSPGGAFGGNMRIAVDVSTDLATWTSSWIDNTHLNNEGAWISKIGGNFYVFAGDGSHFNCWSLAGAFLGTLAVDVAPPTGGNPPAHFIPFQWFDGDTTQYYALSWTNSEFDIGGSPIGVFGSGSPMLYKASQTEVGFEYNATGIT